MGANPAAAGPRAADPSHPAWPQTRGWSRRSESLMAGSRPEPPPNPRRRCRTRETASRNATGGTSSFAAPRATMPMIASGMGSPRMRTRLPPSLFGVLGAILGLALLIQHVQELRAAHLQADRPGSRVWLVYLQRSALFLDVDADTVALVAWSGATNPLRDWRGKQVRSVHVQRVDSGSGPLRRVGPRMK